MWGFPLTTLKLRSWGRSYEGNGLLNIQLRGRLKHWLYALQGTTHARRWRDFSLQNTSVPRFAITLFIHSHPGATQDQIVDHLMSARDYGTRESCVVVVSRNLRDMEVNRQIQAREGGYHSLDHTRFVIRQEEPWFSWFFLVSAGLAVTFFFYLVNMVEYNAHTSLVILLFLVIFVRLIEEFTHTTPY